MQFTKTDFIRYLNCPKSLWLLKREPENYPQGEFSVFLQKLTREGYEVETHVPALFDDGKDHLVQFQRVFESDDGLFARADVIERTASGETVLYEIKSSTKVKTDSQHNHIKDACFQKICAERSGQAIDRVCIVHLNGDYVRDGEIDPKKLLVITDVSKEVAAIESETIVEADEALALLAAAIDKDGCSCLEKSRGNHCETFAIFNPGVPTPSIYSLPRISEKKRLELLSMRIFGLRDIADDYPLSESQRLVVQSAKSGRPWINSDAIKRFLSKLTFPLHFFDYETFASAVPLIDGTSPHKHFPVQYSLHILGEDGTLTHKEYLVREARLPLPLVEQMQIDFESSGSIICWHASFEKKQNADMAELFPQKADFLAGLNDRIVDLEDPFKKDYVDARFDGSTSIKKVLPVLCPRLDYSDLEVQDGSSAMEAWQRMLNAEQDEADSIASALLHYCERDTLAMVEIYRFLAAL